MDAECTPFEPNTTRVSRSRIYQSRTVIITAGLAIAVRAATVNGQLDIPPSCPEYKAVVMRDAPGEKGWVTITMGDVSALAETAEVAQADPPIGINVLLNQEATDEVLDELETYGHVLDVIPEINAVTLRARESMLAAIAALPYVVGASADAQGFAASIDDFADGANLWGLDAINVTDFGDGRTVEYDGEGVYIAVIDHGLQHNWLDYFPEERIAGEFARAFSGGGGNAGTVSSQPEKWANDPDPHATAVTSMILGFHYSLPEPAFPETLNGVAPRATVIPLRVFDSWFYRNSVVAHAVIYAANLKISGALGDSPLIINMSVGTPTGVPNDAMVGAAIDYAIAGGVIVVAAAGNEAGAGMRFPGRYAPVISTAATGWVQQFPPDDPTLVQWSLQDVPESSVSQHYIAPFSAHQLQGQELDVAGPGAFIPAAATITGQPSAGFFLGTSAACPHVAGVAALMLQKNPTLTQSQIEAILKETALTLPPDCAGITFAAVEHGPPASFDNLQSVFLFELETCWESNATGAGLVQADAALAATPLP